MNRELIREALEIGINAVANQGWTRHQEQELKLIQDAMTELYTDDWISIDKVLPEIDQYVLWRRENGFIFYDCIDKDMDIESIIHFLRYLPYCGRVTHWQPLLLGPKE